MLKVFKTALAFVNIFNECIDNYIGLATAIKFGSIGVKMLAAISSVFENCWPSYSNFVEMHIWPYFDEVEFFKEYLDNVSSDYMDIPFVKFAVKVIQCLEAYASIRAAAIVPSFSDSNNTEEKWWTIGPTKTRTDYSSDNFFKKNLKTCWDLFMNKANRIKLSNLRLLASIIERVVDPIVLSSEGADYSDDDDDDDEINIESCLSQPEF